MISGDTLRRYLDAILLVLIKEQDRYGYQLFSELNERTGGGLVIKEATLYAVLQRMEQQGLVSSYQGDVSGGSKRRYYHITQAGRTALNQLIESWREMREIVNIFLEDK